VAADPDGRNVPIIVHTKTDLDDDVRARLHDAVVVLRKSRVSPAEFESRVVSLFTRTVSELDLTDVEEAGP
jgi:hypothetical protein